jgi:hypothetical protein
MALQGVNAKSAKCLQTFRAYDDIQCYKSCLIVIQKYSMFLGEKPEDSKDEI